MLQMNGYCTKDGENSALTLYYCYDMQNMSLSFKRYGFVCTRVHNSEEIDV